MVNVRQKCRRDFTSDMRFEGSFRFHMTDRDQSEVLTRYLVAKLPGCVRRHVNQSIETRVRKASFQCRFGLIGQCTLKTAYKNTKKYQDIRGNVNTLLRKKLKKLSTSTCHARHVDKNAGQRKHNVRQSLLLSRLCNTRFYKTGYAGKSAGWMPWH